jgi:hypothetical protein
VETSSSEHVRERWERQYTACASGEEDVSGVALAPGVYVQWLMSQGWDEASAWARVRALGSEEGGVSHVYP